MSSLNFPNKSGSDRMVTWKAGNTFLAWNPKQGKIMQKEFGKNPDSKKY